jgi:hypothetical protein
MAAPVAAPSCRATANPISAVMRVITVPMGPYLAWLETSEKDIT